MQTSGPQTGRGAAGCPGTGALCELGEGEGEGGREKEERRKVEWSDRGREEGERERERERRDGGRKNCVEEGERNSTLIFCYTRVVNPDQEGWMKT